MKLEYDAIYDDIAGCVTVPLHDKIYEVMRRYDLQDIRIKVELVGLDYHESEAQTDTIETEIPIPDETNMENDFINNIVLIISQQMPINSYALNEKQTFSTFKMIFDKIEPYYDNITIICTQKALSCIEAKVVDNPYASSNYTIKGYPVFIIPNSYEKLFDDKNIYLLTGTMQDIQDGVKMKYLTGTFIEED